LLHVTCLFELLDADDTLPSAGNDDDCRESEPLREQVSFQFISVTSEEVKGRMIVLLDIQLLMNKHHDIVVMQ